MNNHNTSDRCTLRGNHIHRINARFDTGGVDIQAVGQALMAIHRLSQDIVNHHFANIRGLY